LTSLSRLADFSSYFIYYGTYSLFRTGYLIRVFRKLLKISGEEESEGLEMKKAPLILSSILVLSLFIFLFATKPPARDVRVGALYYPWYREGNGTDHWSGRPEWRVVDIPYFGYYSTQDNATILRQLDAMHAAGIDFILLSWWGQYAPWEDTSCKYIFQAINDSYRTTMKAFLMVEEILATPTYPSNYSDIYDYVYENYVVPYGDVYFKLNNKPFLSWWACRNMTDNATVRQNWVYNSSETRFESTIIVGHHHDYADWYGWTPSASTPTETTLTFGQRDGFIFIEPRYDDTFKMLWEPNQPGTTI
jgi:hypothetical protein